MSAMERATDYASHHNLARHRSESGSLSSSGDNHTPPLRVFGNHQPFRRRDMHSEDDSEEISVQHTIKLTEGSRSEPGIFTNQELLPPVLWRARIFDARKSNAKLPQVEYKSQEPLDLVQNGTQEKQGQTQPIVANGADHSEKWENLARNQSVFEVCRTAVAHFPSKTNGNRQSKHSSVPIDALKVTNTSHISIDLLSPFLVHKLGEFVNYYPDFKKLAAFTEKKRVVVPQPWAVLFHAYAKLESYVLGNDEDLPAQPQVSSNKPKVIRRIERAHCGHLYEFLKPHYNTHVQPWLSELDKSVPELPFSILWYLLRPGTDVYVLTAGRIQACTVFRLHSNIDVELENSPHNLQSSIQYWKVGMWYLDSDGYRIAKVPVWKQIKAYEGTKPLTSLAICPCTTWDRYDEGARRKKMIARGQLMFDSLCKGHLLATYAGPIADSSRHFSGAVVVDCKTSTAYTQSKPPQFSEVDADESKFAAYDAIFIKAVNVDGHSEDDYIRDNQEQLYRDPRIARASPPYRLPSTLEALREAGFPAGQSTYGNKSTKDDFDDPQHTSQKLTTELTEHQLLLLYPTIRAFSLETKSWLTLFPDFLTPVVPSSESIANLVLGETEMATIKALANRQNSKRENWAADFVSGKGIGHIILLHGPPGVGKTYTVEAIAQYLHRPLLTLTVADIGTVETRVESELLKWFSLAEVWNAVLLVDEADIFLERRQNRDLARNGLVSAFLRRMEYFKGLLFLTTNRVGQIDDAFISRIHVAIGYEALNPESRSKIWQGFFSKLARERAGKIQISPAARKWVLGRTALGGLQMNGRDIRNSLQTAITLAEAEHEEDPDFDPEKMTVIIDQSHFQRVLDITDKFHSYVQSIRREDERKRAAGRHDRNDYWHKEESSNPRGD
ncbi:NTP/NDP exchange transporter [Microdochium nivale]|nr:NTP/NDP exchange transporter [Microdochium nivale]